MSAIKVGIIGAGQLARMMALAGLPLGMQFKVLDPAADACAGQVCELIQAKYDDAKALQVLAQWADVITFDFENVPATAIAAMSTDTKIYPPERALATAQDRLNEKNLFRELNIPTPDYANILEFADLERTVAEIGLPAVLKTRRLGYDGKGQRVLKSTEDVTTAYEQLGDVPLILERFLEFEREVSLLTVRTHTGQTAFYPLTENTHQQGILHQSIAPFDDCALNMQAREYAERVCEKLNYVGVLAIELFVVQGQLFANEMAPRVHNSGHWTIEGAVCSQFENHLRAICGLPLGSTAARGFSTMLNCIAMMPNRGACLAVPGAHYHDYGKQARAGRKLGHVTVCADESQTLQQVLAELKVVWEDALEPA